MIKMIIAIILSIRVFLPIIIDEILKSLNHINEMKELRMEMDEGKIEKIENCGGLLVICYK